MSRNNWFIIFLFIIPPTLFLAGAIKYTPSIFDDAYNYMRYAKNFLAGYGQSYNIDEGPIYGLTSQLYFYYHLVINGLLPFPDHIILVLSSALMGAAAFILLLVICHRMCPDVHAKFKHSYYFIAILGVIIMSKPFVFHSFTGMDTTTSLLINILLIGITIQFTRTLKIKHLLFTIGTAFLCIFTRPDNAIYAYMFPFLMIITDKKIAHKWKYAIVFVVGLTILNAVDLILKNYLLGSYLPTTWLVKQQGFLEGYKTAYLWNSMEYFIQYLLTTSPFIIILIVTTTRQSRLLVLSFTLPVLLTFGYYFGVFQIMGFESRYYFPSLGYIVISAVMAMNYLFQSEKVSIKKSIFNPARALGILVLFTLLSNGNVLASKYSNVFLYKSQQYEADIQLTTPAGSSIDRTEWLYHYDNIYSLALKLPEGACIATTETGRISALAPQIKLVDLIGFHNKNIAYNGFEARTLIKKHPDIIFIHHVYTKMNKQLIELELFQQDYDFYPGAFYGGLAIRKDSRYYSELSQIMMDIWSTAYPGTNMKNYMATFNR